MAGKLEPLPGTTDIFPDQTAGWRLLEETAHRLFPRYGYGELRTPIFERTDVFLRSIGDETDIVQKEMYTFRDRGNRSLTLRPEGTAGTLRAIANAGVPQGDERRVYYLGPMFRGERPAAGRKRQFHQIGTECVGKIAPAIDVETIAMLMDYLAAIELPSDTLTLLLNTRGTAADREPVAGLLRDYFTPLAGDLCEDCQRRLQTNVWRILDCKVESCQPHIDAAPNMSEQLGQESRDFFARVRAGLDALGIAYRIDPRLVRGLDYYQHTVFEVTFAGIGAQNSLAGGGRYEIAFGSKPLIGVGFAVGLERLLMAREELGILVPEVPQADVYLVGLGEAALTHNLVVARDLRECGVKVAMDLEGRGMKAQLRAANRSGARLAIIVGDSELTQGVVQLKDLESSEQLDVLRADLLAEVERRLW